MGTKADVAVGVFAGPFAFAVLEMTKYAMAQRVCVGDLSRVPMEVATILSLLVIGVGAVLSWAALQRTPAGAPTDGRRPPEITRFLALYGLASCALFGIAAVALDMPNWWVHGCQ